MFVASELPDSIEGKLRSALLSSDEVLLDDSAEGADVWIGGVREAGAVVVGEAVFVVVAPFPTITDEVTWADVVDTWRGSPAGPFASRKLLMSPDTGTLLTTLMGGPASPPVEIVREDDLLQYAWDTRPAWAIVPFDHLDPRWKALRLDGQSVLDRGLVHAAYPLTVQVGVEGTADAVSRVQSLLGSRVTNRETERMSVVMMTGVTALTRYTGRTMDRSGVEYPAQDISPWLSEPDITHISSEVSFAENCPPPNDPWTTTFCSDPTYIGLIDTLDIDIIELTGNHLLDWGVAAMELTLSMYDERNIPYYGGGWNLVQAQTPVTLSAGLHTFAFLGCNPAGPRSDWATEDAPGSAPCDYALLYEQTRSLRDQGIIPIVTLQYRESYQYEPLPQQRTDFEALAEAGAVIVSGSQAHQPQGFGFAHGAFIHFGLGNLFFDQMWYPETRQEFIDRHVFYEGRHISTEVLTAMLEEYARPRPMTPAERETLLGSAFAASGW